MNCTSASSMVQYPALARAKAALAALEVTAPFAGTVVSVPAHVGEYSAPGAPVAYLADLSGWQVETTDLTELSVVNVHEGDPVTVTFDALPDLKLAGKVVTITRYGENKQGDIVYTVVVRLDQQDERLDWNMTAQVDIAARP